MASIFVVVVVVINAQLEPEKLQTFHFAYEFNYPLWIIGYIEDFNAIIFAFGFVHSLIQLTETVADEVFQRPNVIFILADDLVRVKKN